MQRPHRLHPSRYVGLARHFLTICTRGRRRHFADAANVAAVTEQFLSTAFDTGFAVFAYCLMPDHMHALVVAESEAADFAEFVRLFKQRTAFAFKRRADTPLWQASYFDRTLRENDESRDTVVYIVNNPVRAHLVASPREYPHWGSQVYTREEILEFVACARV
jgi:REP element-mobilizing transposase RayT